MSGKSIDRKKFKNMLSKVNIIIIDYYILDGECAMIKCFLAKSFEFLLIYIPSKYRFSMDPSPEKNIFEIKIIDENSECDDYTKTGKQPEIDPIDGEKSVNLYTELTRKYHRDISTDNEEEPIERTIRRQVSRLKIPFKNLKYDISIQNKKILCVSFGDDLNLFNIKGTTTTDLIMMYVINLKDFIDQIDEIQLKIDIVKKQFYKIVQKISISNIESIPNIDTRINIKITEKIKSYQGYVEEYQEIYDKAIEKENDIVKKYKNLLVSTTADIIKKNSIEKEAEKELKASMNVKIEIIEAGIGVVSSIQKNLLRWEEIGFDNLIMMEKVQRNFDKLEKYFK